MARVQELNAYLVLKRGDKVLMLRRKNGWWEFPGGGVEFGEHPKESAKRECAEETGIKVEDVRGPIAVTSAVYEKDGVLKHSVYVVYLAEVEHEISARLCREHEEARWVAISEAEELPLALNARGVIKVLQ